MYVEHAIFTSARTESLEGTVGGLSQRQTESEMRLTTEVVHVAQILDSVKDLLREKLEDHKMVHDHERRISVLETTTG